MVSDNTRMALNFVMCMCPNVRKVGATPLDSAEYLDMVKAFPEHERETMDKEIRAILALPVSEFLALFVHSGQNYF